MKRILIFTFSLLYEDCIFSINSIFYTHNYTILKKLFSALCFLGHNKDKTNISQKQVFCLYFIAKMKKKLITSKGYIKDLILIEKNDNFYQNIEKILDLICSSFN
jgi:hypothetical protein